MTIKLLLIWEQPRLVCVLRTSKNATADEIVDFVGGQIARYKSPKHVVFVDKLPRTAGWATSTGPLSNQPSGAGLTGFHDQIRSRDEKHRRRHHRDLEMSTQSIRQHVGCR